MTDVPVDLYCTSTPVVEYEHGTNGEGSLAESVVTAISQAAGSDPLELPPLYESIEPDILDMLTRDRTDGDGTNRVLCFKYSHWAVFVRGDGRIIVSNGSDSSTPQQIF